MKNDDELKEKTAKAGNPLIILFIFAILVGFVFYIPEIYQKYNSDIAEFLGIGSKYDKETEYIDERASMSDYYQLGSRSELEYNEIKITDVLLDGNYLNMTITSDSRFDLDESDYYLEFYISKATFVGRRNLHGVVDKVLNLKIDVTTLGLDTSIYMALSHIAKGGVPKFTPTTDESGLGEMICKNYDNRQYTYEFEHDSLLKVKYEYHYTASSLEEYSLAYQSYQKLNKDYNEYSGITASLSGNYPEFVFLSEFDYTDAQKFSKINDKKIFKQGDLASYVKFKMDSEGYDCE